MRKIRFLSLLLCFSYFSFSAKGQNSSEKTKAILDAYFVAIGGKEKAALVKNLSIISTGILENKKVVLTQKLMLPNFYYSSMDLDGYLVSKKVFNGIEGYHIQQDIEQNLDSKEIKKMRKHRSIFPEFDYYETAKYIGIEIISNRKIYVLEVENSKIYYDAETGFKIKGIVINSKGDYTFEQQLFYSKYIEIDGLKFPSKMAVVAGNKKIEFNAKTIVNASITAKDFK